MYKTNDFHGYEPVAVFFSFESEFLVRRNALWDIVTIKKKKKPFKKCKHGNAGRSTVGRTNFCPFHDKLPGAISGVQVFSLLWQVEHSCYVAL